MKLFATFVIATFLMLFLSPSVSAQSRRVITSNECRGVISLEMGAHRVFVDGPYGGHFGLSIENIIGKKFSFGFSAKDFVNSFSGITTEKNVVEHRIVFQPSFYFYPQYALRGFYMQLGCGGLMYLNNAQSTVIQKEEALIQVFPEFKMGVQSINRDNFVWNVYAGGGVFIPTQLFEAIPVFEVGLKLGMKY